MILFSINRSRGYENPSLEIIVIENFLTRGFPLEEACEHFSLNQSAIFVVVLVSFMCYCGDNVGYITVILPVITLNCTIPAYLASGLFMPLPSQSHAE
jgi:hypothetical protein